MVDFTFRYRLRLAARSSVSSSEPRLELLQLNDLRKVELASPDGKLPLNKSRDLVLRAGGWPSTEHAAAEGRMYSDRLAIAFVRHRIGVYPADIAPGGHFFKAGLRMLEGELGGRILEDTYGLAVYESEPTPRFASVGPATLIMGIDAARLRQSFLELCTRPIALSNREQLAIDLFNSSFLELNSNTRLLTLVMAVESLTQLQPRPSSAVALVDSFLNEVSSSNALSPKEKDSLCGSLRHLRSQSIGEATQDLVSTRLNGRVYMKLSPPKFFAQCYTVRSKLVHGTDPPPRYSEVGQLAATLEVLVSDLLTQPFFEKAG